MSALLEFLGRRVPALALERLPIGPLRRWLHPVSAAGQELRARVAARIPLVVRRSIAVIAVVASVAGSFAAADAWARARATAPDGAGAIVGPGTTTSTPRVSSTTGPGRPAAVPTSTSTVAASTTTRRTTPTTATTTTTTRSPAPPEPAMTRLARSCRSPGTADLGPITPTSVAAGSGTDPRTGAPNRVVTVAWKGDLGPPDGRPPYSVVGVLVPPSGSPSVASPRTAPPIDRVGAVQLWFAWDGHAGQKGIRRWQDGHWVMEIGAPDLTVNFRATGTSLYWKGISSGWRYEVLVANLDGCRFLGPASGGRLGPVP